MSTRVPVVALVGRPNVGKSTLFNRLAGRKLALVDDQPGVTRDRLVAEALLDNRRVLVVDTGGLDADPSDPLLASMREQTEAAIEMADLVLHVVDADAGLTPADKDVADLLRRSTRPTVVVGNKVDNPDRDALVGELYALGAATVVGVSAEHGRNMEPLVDAILAAVDAPTAEEVPEAQAPLVFDEPLEGDGESIEWSGGPIRVAVVGQPNVGKSSLVNRLLGQERLVASDVAGTTRDSVDVPVVHEDQEYVFVDTAGLRRKSKLTERIEKVSALFARRAIESADVVVVVLDGAARPTKQDATIASLAHESGKGVVLVANKWDLVENPEWREKYPEAVRVDLPFVTYADLVRLSAKTGRGVGRLYKAILAAQRERHRRISTGALNRFFKEVVERHPPPSHKGRQPKLYFVSQPLVRPPTFIFTASRTDEISEAYRRYLQNSLRERYGFGGTPIWVKLRGR